MLPKPSVFKLNKAYDSVINAIRRTLISNLPVKCFDKIIVEENTTQIYPIEYIIQRFKLIPLNQETAQIKSKYSVVIQNRSSDYRKYTVKDMVDDNKELKISLFNPEIIDSLLLDLPPLCYITLTLEITGEYTCNKGACFKGIHAWYTCNESNKYTKFDENIPKIKGESLDKMFPISPELTKNIETKSYNLFIEHIYKFIDIPKTLLMAKNIIHNELIEAKNIFSNSESENESNYCIRCNIGHTIMNLIRESTFNYLAGKFKDFGPQDFLVSYDNTHRLEENSFVFLLIINNDKYDPKETVLTVIDLLLETF